MARHAQHTGPLAGLRIQLPQRHSLVAMIVATALALAGIGGVIAWLTASNQVSNAFEVGKVDVTLNEEGPTDGKPFEEGDSVKNNVTVTNNGNVPVYVRARVDIYWEDAKGNQLWDAPVEDEDAPVEDEDADYTVSWGANLDGQTGTEGWVEGLDGYYYWTKPVPGSGTTGNLIDSFAPATGAASADKKLVCDIAIQSIQADPSRAVTEAWGVTIADGILTPPTTQNGGSI